MLTGLDGQKLFIQNPAGVEKYSYNLYEAMARFDHTNTFVVYLKQEPDKSKFQELVSGNPNFSYKVISSSGSWTQIGLARELFKDLPDIYYSPFHTLPSIKPKKTKYVSMIHGLEYTYLPTFKSGFKRPLAVLFMKNACRSADIVIVPSIATKDEILKKKWATNIEVIYEGVNPGFHKYPDETVSSIKNKYKINGSYFIFVSTIQPRKNLPATIESFSLAARQSPNLAEKKLVVIGKPGWQFEESYEAPKRFGIEDRVMFLGRLPDNEVQILVSGADCFVNFSLEEGFGLPLVEAMASEVKCLVSDIPPFREIAKDSAIYANPLKLDNMKDGFLKAVAEVYPLEKIVEAKNRTAEFTWEATAKKTLNTFQSLVKNL